MIRSNLCCLILPVLLLCGSRVSCGYSDLIGASDGSAVVFQVSTGFSTSQGFQLRLESGRPVARAVSPGFAPSRFVADISEDGSVVATTYGGQKRCGVFSSTCFLAPACIGGFSVEGPGLRVETSDRRTTFIRLSRRGGTAWIEQSEACEGLGTAPPALHGLYDLPGLRPIAASPEATAANQRPGRRIITNQDQVLVLGGEAKNQLQLLAAFGVRLVRHQFPVAEAVIDAEGRNVVYADGLQGRLRWIDVGLQRDEDLGPSPIFGTAPALSDDGRVLAFLSSGGRLLIYQRVTRSFQQIDGIGAQIQDFVLTGNGRFLFVATQSGHLVRVEAASGRVETWLPPFPEIRGVSTRLARNPNACPLVCYSPGEPLVQLGRGALVVLHGKHLDSPGWQVRVGEAELPLRPLSQDAAWFQAPGNLRGESGKLMVFHPRHPLQFVTDAQAVDRLVSCFGALHERFDHLVSPADPARPGAIIHVFLTGLQGIERVPEGTPNPTDRLIPVASPPELNGALEPLFFGLAPGLIGLQQLDARVLRHVPRPEEQSPPRSFPNEQFESGCELPPTAPEIVPAPPHTFGHGLYIRHPPL